MAKKIYSSTVQDTDYFAMLSGVSTTTSINTSSTTQDVRKYGQKTLLLKATGIANTGIGSFSVRVSADNSDWYSYDRLITGAGVDAPVSKVALKSNGQDVAIIPDYVGYVKVMVDITKDGSYSCTLCVSL